MMRRTGIRTFRRFLLFLLLTPLAVNAQIAEIALRQGDTPLGVVRIGLDFGRAPRAVANFIGLATGQFAWVHPETGMLMEDTPYYDGLIFHRLIHNFMIQGGCPLGTGGAGPGYVFQDQFDPGLPHIQYMISMAHSGPNSNGSQFFITLANTPHLNNYHTVFGMVLDDGSRAIIDQLANPALHPTDSNDRPLTNIVIDSITFGPGIDTLDLFDPALKLPRVRPQSIAIEAHTEDLKLTWPAEALSIYPIGFTSNLLHGFSAGQFLMVQEEEDPIEIQITSQREAAFYSVFAVDYSAVPIAPTNVLAEGTVLEMALHGGTLAVTFGSGAAGDIGTWSYTASDNSVSTGVLTDAQPGVFELTNRPIYPSNEEPAFRPLNDYRYLSNRALFLEFDPEVGPLNVLDIETYLSFHDNQSGWINDAWYNNQAGSFDQYIRGPFTISTP